MAKIKILTMSTSGLEKKDGISSILIDCYKYFDKEKYDVRVMLPKYMCMKEEWKEKLIIKDRKKMNVSSLL